MTANKNILINGAGIAGLTLAYWLHEFGFQPVVVEKRPDLSDEGYMIDFYGSGYDLAEKMNLLEPLRARHYSVPKLKFVDRNGHTRATLDLEKFRQALDFRHFNFMRGDLAAVLAECVQTLAPVRFGAGVAAAQADDAGVAVELADGAQERYDLLIGADGFHSTVRRLLWGEERQFENFLGYYVACDVIGRRPEGFDTFYSYMEPKRQASVYPIRGGRLATFFAFKSARRDAAETSQQMALLNELFGGMGWIVPELLDDMSHSPDLYFDAVSQIKLDEWHRGRVALVGDACYCLTLLAGQGASMAMAGAYILAEELRNAEGDYQAAFAAYQRRLQPEIADRQERAKGLAGSFVPDSEFAIWMTNIFLKVAFWPGFRSIFKRQIGASSIIH